MEMTSKIYAKEILNKINDEVHIEMYTIDKKIREKNLDFMQKYHLNLDDVKDYIHCLKEENFKSKIKTEDKEISSEYLYEFNINTNLEDDYNISELVSIYIKIGYLCSEEGIILVVSFHD